MITDKFRGQIESLGATLIESRCVVFVDAEGIHGVDEEGEPIVKSLTDINSDPTAPHVIIPEENKVTWYIGNTAEEVKSKMRDKTPDLEVKNEKAVS